jgi:hypothetical protein
MQLFARYLRNRGPLLAAEPRCLPLAEWVGKPSNGQQRGGGHRG